jgi:hypothetical protein
MSRRQQLVTRYVGDLCPCLAVRYRFHFLRTETDPSAQQMLSDELRNYSRSNAGIGNCISTPTSLKWTISDDENQSHSTSSLLHQARTYFSSFHIDSALKLFERDKRANPDQSSHFHYLERLQINLALGRWNKALSLALKIPNITGIFLSAIASADFDRAALQLPGICREFANLKSSHGTKELLVSPWELAHLIVYVVLARCSSHEIESQIQEVQNFSQYNFNELVQFAQLFASRSFQRFIAKLNELKKEFVLSYYIEEIAAVLEREIRMNVIVNVVNVYSKVSLGQVAEIVGLDQQKVANALARLIENGRVRGFVDRIEGKFYGNDQNVEDLETGDQFERTVLVRERLELLKWKLSYQKAIPK